MPSSKLEVVVDGVKFGVEVEAELGKNRLKLNMEYVYNVSIVCSLIKT